MKPEYVEEIRLLLEKDMYWRSEEFNFLSGLLNEIRHPDLDKSELLKNKYRKSLILMLYSHFEGYFKYCFEIYAGAINEEKVSIETAIDELKVSTLNESYNDYDNAAKWANIESEFERKNKRFINRIKLYKSVVNPKERVIALPISADHNNKHSVVYTGSNLTSEVIMKILYQLGLADFGLPKKEFEDLMSMVNIFIYRRNGIAHGDNKIQFKNGVSERDFDSYFNLFQKITNRIPVLICNQLSKELYLLDKFRKS